MKKVPIFNAKLRAARLANSWTLAVAAEKASVSLEAYSRWEYGVQDPRLSSLLLLSEGFGLSPDELGFGHLVKHDQGPSTTNFIQSTVDETRETVLVSPEASASSSAADLLEIGVKALSLAQKQKQWTAEELMAHIESAVRSMFVAEQQGSGKITRREALDLLAGLSLTLLGVSSQQGSPAIAEEVLPFCAPSITAYWQAVYSGGIPQVERALPHFLQQVTALAQQPIRYQKLAANLASQGYKLAILLDMRREDFVTALHHSKEALSYGQIAEDANLQMAALIEEALTFWYRKRPSQTLATYQSALRLSKDVSPLLKGRLYVGLGEAYARVGQEQEALRYMGLAHDTFPDHPQDDPNFSYTHYDHYYLYLYEGLMYLKLGQPEHALRSYARLNTPLYASRKTEISGREAAALLAVGDLDQCCMKVETAANLALSIDSDLRYSEALDIHQGMLIKWPHERQVLRLTELFQR